MSVGILVFQFSGVERHLARVYPSLILPELPERDITRLVLRT